MAVTYLADRFTRLILPCKLKYSQVECWMPSSLIYKIGLSSPRECGNSDGCQAHC